MATARKLVKDLSTEQLNKNDLDNLINFTEPQNTREQKLYTEIACKMHALRLIDRPKLNLLFKQPLTFVKYYFWDMDFGPVDRMLRIFRRSQVLKALNNRNNLVLIDVGCGRQANVGWVLRKQLKSYIGVDRDIPELSLFNLNFVNSLAETMSGKLKNNTADMVIALAVIEHVEDPESFVRTCKKLLKKDGEILLTTPAPYADPILKLISKLKIINGDEIEEHKTYFSPSTLAQLLEKNGFKILKAQKFLFGLNGVVHAKVHV